MRENSFASIPQKGVLAQKLEKKYRHKESKRLNKLEQERSASVMMMVREKGSSASPRPDSRLQERSASAMTVLNKPSSINELSGNFMH